jgi:ABC-type uncharacterized transport system involved in gliding motility auxiliary subunit
MTRALSFLGWMGTAMVFAAAAARLLGWAGTYEITERMDQYARYGLWAGLALVVLYTLGQWRDIVASFKNRQTRNGALSGISVIVALGILVAVNYLSFRQSKRWDLTENRQFSLSEQTTKLLGGLTTPVKFLVFDKAEQFDRFRARLTEYQYQSPQVQTEYVDVEKNPVRTRQYEVDTYGTVIVEYMGRTERLTTDTEQDLTNALIKVINPAKKKVYFLGGHGEKDTASSDNRVGYSAIADALKRDNYEFASLVLAQTNEVPADANIVVIAGPRTDLLEQEIQPLRDHLGRAKALLVLLDPPDNLAAPVPMPQITGLLAEWGIEATPTVIVDVSGQTRVATIPVSGPPYPTHPITEGFQLVTMFPMARAIVPTAQATDGRAAQPFLQTSPRSWAETTFTQLEDPNALKPETEQGDRTGPVTIGVAVNVAAPAQPGSDSSAGDAAKPAGDTAKPDEPASKAETRVAAIGDSDFASNGYLGVEGNRDLFMNSLSWLAQQENLIAIRPREAADRRLTIAPGQMTILMLLSLVLVPAGVLGLGLFTWWRRRSH